MYIGIVGVIATFAIPKYTNTVAMANTAKIQSDLQTLDAAITMYNLQNGKNPENISALDEYIAHIDQVKPPTGKCLLKDGTSPVIVATTYAINGDGEATLDEKTLDKFGKGTATA